VIEKERLKKLFLSLVRLSSESLSERLIAHHLKAQLESLGAAVVEDRAASAVGGNCGNLIARFGTRGPFLMLNSHMDTVRPGRNVQPVVKGDIIRSDGRTVLGADCKSGIAAIMEALESVREDRGVIEGIEVVFTVAEEVGLLGAKQLKRNAIKSKIGITLDSGDPYNVIIAAPAANRIMMDIHGFESHAGVAPEKGISAILIAAQALRAMKLGRIDHETTANIGIIEGGNATNIVPALVQLKGEARSHNTSKLERQTKQMIRAAETAAKKAAKNIDGKTMRPTVKIAVKPDYPAMKIKPNSPVMKVVKAAGVRAGLKLSTKAGNGGSDANIFNSIGIQTVILGTGMTDVHSTRENINVRDMVKAARLVRAAVDTFLEER